MIAFLLVVTIACYAVLVGAWLGLVWTLYKVAEAALSPPLSSGKGRMGRKLDAAAENRREGR